MSVVNKFINLSQAQVIANDIINKVKDKNYLEAANLPSYTIKKQAEAETGYAHTYQLFEVLGEGASATETAVGAKINIPKDMVVSEAEVKTVETADVPYEGAVVGDKYIDLTIANSSGTHVYIPVNELVDAYTGGDGIAVSAQNEISVDIDSTDGNGLGITNGGKLKLDVATPDVYSGGTKTTDGTAGAMSSADKYKLDNADVTPYTEGNGIDITNHTVSVVVDSSNANGLGVTSAGVKLDVVTPSVSGVGGTNGAMSAEDKEKLDNADVDAYTAGNGIDITSHAVSVEVDSSNANGLSATANGVALATATADTWGGVQATGTYVAGTTYYTTAACTTEVDTSDFVPGTTDVSSYFVYAKTADGANGAFTSVDKAKLDSMTAATNAEVDAMIATLDNL